MYSEEHRINVLYGVKDNKMISSLLSTIAFLVFICIGLIAFVIRYVFRFEHLRENYKSLERKYENTRLAYEAVRETNNKLFNVGCNYDELLEENDELRIELKEKDDFIKELADKYDEVEEKLKQKQSFINHLVDDLVIAQKARISTPKSYI